MAEESKADNSTTSSSAPSKMAKLVFEKIPASDLHVSRVGGWLESRFHFRFADWCPSDPKRRGFGALHVMNDDIVQASNGFGTHPHANQEIFSYILEGSLTHQDSKGNKETLGRGHVQYISAGAGVWHSEMNHDKKSSCRFLQTWIYPNKASLPVQYGSHQPTLADRSNQLYHVINGELKSGQPNDANNAVPIRLHQDVNVYVSELDAGKSVQYQLGKDRQAYLVCPEGSVRINDECELETRAAVRLFGEANLNIVAIGKDKKQPAAHIMMIEMKKE